MAEKSVSVESTLGEDFVIKSDVRGHEIIIDQPTTGGGTDAGASPLELMLVALGGCIGTIARLIARQQRLDLRGMQIKVEGSIDTDGLLGKPIDGRIGFNALNVTVDIDADMTDAEKESFIHEVDARCPVSENLLNATSINVKSV